MYGMVTKIHQGIYVFHGNQIHTAAITAITAVRAAQGDVFFASKTNRAITTVTRFYANFCLINKSHKLHAAKLKTQAIKTKKAPS
jgi:hypothetical protein